MSGNPDHLLVESVLECDVTRETGMPGTGALLLVKGCGLRYVLLTTLSTGIPGSYNYKPASSRCSEMVSVCVDFVSPQEDASRIVYGLAIGLPTLVFIMFLSWNLKACLRKLRSTKSQIMTAYYTFLWMVCVLNVVRCAVHILETADRGGTVAWNILWLLTRFGMVALEISVVVFLFQGYIVEGLSALRVTMLISLTVAGLETLTKALIIFAAHVPLFVYGGGRRSGPKADMTWSKWGFWLLHSLLFASVYGSILVLRYTRWRDMLPARPSFFYYIGALLSVNLVFSLGAIIIGSGVTAGYCLYGLANWVYYALYPPLLYLTFLAEFFQDDDYEYDMLMYSEMRDAGCFDSGYEPL